MLKGHLNLSLASLSGGNLWERWFSVQHRKCVGSLKSVITTGCSTSSPGVTAPKYCFGVDNTHGLLAMSGLNTNYESHSRGIGQTKDTEYAADNIESCL